MFIKEGDLLHDKVNNLTYRAAYDFNTTTGVGFTELWLLDGSDYICATPKQINEHFVKVLGQFSDHVEQFIPTHVENKLLWLITGLIEENGELLQIVRESEYKYKDADREHLKEELGDIFYYFTGLLNHFGITLDEVKQNNVEKLNTRFPMGRYDIKASIEKRDHNE